MGIERRGLKEGGQTFKTKNRPSQSKIVLEKLSVKRILRD